MSLPESYACRSPIYSSLERLFAPNVSIPYPSHVYIYGNHNTGKSTLIKQALNTHQHSILWFDCREIYSMNMFYQTFLSSFTPTPPSVKSFNDFVRVLRDCSITESAGKKKKSKVHYFVVLHHIELLLNYDTSGHLLYLLFKLNELTLGHFQHSLILIGHQAFFNLSTMSQIEAELGVLTPTTLFVPAYTRPEVVSILQQTLLRRFLSLFFGKRTKTNHSCLPF